MSPEGREFYAEQARAEAEKSASKKENPKRQARMEAKLRKPMRPVEFERIAKKKGVPIVNGGNHKQVVNPDTHQKCAYTRHPGTMSPQVQRSAVKFLSAVN